MENQSLVIVSQEIKTYLKFRYFLERILSFFVIILFAPIFLFVSLCIKLVDSEGPVVYKQERIGKDGERFYIYKFRTMITNADEILKQKILSGEIDPLNFKDEDDPRITSIGKFLRKTSLDELPQLFNILKGEMSVIGPRPIQQYEIDNFSNKYLLEMRKTIKPGLICYWQITNNKNELPFEERMLLDVEYLEKHSFFEDVIIFVNAVKTILFGNNH